MARITCLSFGFVLMFMACSRVPEGIIPEKKMKDVLVDMQIAEEMINTDPYVFRGNEEKNTLYRSVFRKYGVTEAEYDSSLVWYGKHLDAYMRISKSALAEVQKRIDALGDAVPEPVPESNRDSLDIWIFRRHYELSPRMLEHMIAFDIEPGAAYSPGSAFVLGLNVWGITPQMTKPVEIRLHTVSDDTTYTVSRTVRENGYYEMMLKVNPVKRTQRVYGHIRLDGKAGVCRKIYLDQLQLTKYRYGSPALEDDSGTRNVADGE
ncbi:MAG: DUF4296 domain-containing protein [Tannerella sp.]|jgi:hypothetical protein|nr:DUF4296 domain-containing protein [Tannerella sp.]